MRHDIKNQKGGEMINKQNQQVLERLRKESLNPSEVEPKLIAYDPNMSDLKRVIELEENINLYVEELKRYREELSYLCNKLQVK